MILKIQGQMLSFILDKELASEAFMISSQMLIIYRNILPFTFQLKFMRATSRISYLQQILFKFFSILEHVS